MLLLFTKPATTQLTFDPRCYSVTINGGTNLESRFDGSVLIDKAFDIIVQMGFYADQLLSSVLWNTNENDDWGNTQRVVDLLKTLCIPPGQPHFTYMTGKLLGEHHGIMDPVQVLISVTRSISRLQHSIKRQV